ncbi:MAG: hypothetical protein ABIJ03_00930 [Patescibacteria group bacterium]
MKQGHQTSVRPRTGGGMSQGLGQFGEHLDESALKQAVGQKALGQAQVDPKMAQMAAQGAKQQQAVTSGQTKPPWEVGTLVEELIQWPLQSMGREIRAFFTLQTWLGINPDTKDPKEKQKQATIHRRYQQLDEEQQALVKQRYQERLQKEKAEEEEKQKKKQAEEAKKKQELPMPSSPRKGPIGPAGDQSRKQNATALLEQQRKTMSQGGGSN